MMDLSHKDRDLFLANANLTLITHLGVNIVRWSIVRSVHLFALLAHLALLVLCFFFARHLTLILAIAGTVIAHFLLYRFTHASIALNVTVLKRMQVDYEKYNTPKTDRSKSRTGMALH